MLIFLISLFDDKVIVRLYINDKSDIDKIISLGINDISAVDLRKKYIDVVVSEIEYNKIKNLYPNEIRLRSSDLRTLINFGPYYTYSEAMNEIQNFYNNYPNLVSQPFLVGLTWENRQIKAIKISSNNNQKPVVWFNSAIHAREPGGVSVLLGFAHYLLKNYNKIPEITYLLDNRDIYIIPVTNPDGYVFNESYSSGLWRKNKRDNNNNGVFETNYDGVDLNRNFGYMWGCCNGSSPNPPDDIYRGPYPFSEPESQAYRNFFNQVKPTIGVDIHTYSNLNLWPWGYTSTPTPDDSAYRTLAWKMFRHNAYRSFQAINLYVTDGTTDDWIYGATNEHPKALGWTFEVGENFYQPDTNIILEQVGENIFPLLYLVKSAGPYIEIDTFKYSFALDTIKIYIKAQNLGFNSPINNLYVKMTILDSLNAVGIDTIVYIGNVNSIPYGSFSANFKFKALNNCQNFKIKFRFYNNLGFSQDVYKFIAGQKLVIFNDDFNSNTNWLVNGGTWVFSNGYLRTNPSGSLYNNNLNTDVRISSPLNVSNYDYIEAIITHRWRIEGNYNVLDNVYDFASLDFSNDNKLFIPIRRFWGINSNFRSDTFDITNFKSNSLYLRLKFYSDQSARDSGWIIDKIQILGANACNTTKGEEFSKSDFSRLKISVKDNLIILNVPYKSKVEVKVYSINGSLILNKIFDYQEEIKIKLKRGLFIVNVKTNREEILQKIVF